MSIAPDVSVVMGVYNGAPTLPETLSSVLTQSDCAFEFIVVNDGSTDDSARILDEFGGRDPRLRVIHQRNTGLTRALIRGCAVARGDVIARQDAGDLSLPGRLAAQLSFLHAQPHAVMVACAVQVCGPVGEPLYRVTRPLMELDAGLRQIDLENLRGPPHHGATMFRRDTYERVGAYRAPFTVAQDIDLWLRLADHGCCFGLTQILYHARLEPGSISSRRRAEQFRMAHLALECARIRRAGGDDQSLLVGVRKTPAPMQPLSARERARFHYFVASCMRQQNPASANAHFRQALRYNPLHLKALLHWMGG